MQIEAVQFEPLTDAVFLESVKADRLVYGTRESSTVAVRNSLAKPQQARLVVEVESSLGEPVTLHDAKVEIPAAGAADGAREAGVARVSRDSAAAEAGESKQARCSDPNRRQGVRGWFRHRLHDGGKIVVVVGTNHPRT